MPWQNAGTPIQALGLVKRTGFDARTASRPANTQTVLNNVSLDIDGAGLTAIVGPSGAGKTSLLYVLSGLDRPDSGRVTIGGTDVYALNEERRSRFIRGHIGFVFQQYNLVPYLTVEENVMLPLSLAHRKADYVQVTAAAVPVRSSPEGEDDGKRPVRWRTAARRPVPCAAHASGGGVRRRADRRARHREQRACAAGAARAGGCGLQRGHGHA